MLSHFAPVLTLALVCVATAQEKQQLRLQFTPGYVFHTLMTQESVMNTSMQGQKTDTTIKMQMWSETTIKEVKEGVASFEHKYTRIKIGGAMPTAKVDYDSDVPGSKEGPFAGIGKAVGQVAKMRVDVKGKVLECTVPGELHRAGQVAGTDMEQSLTQGFTALPQDAIAIGDTWKSNTEIAMGQMGDVKTEVTNKLLGVEGPVASIEQKLAMDTSTAKVPGNMKLDVTKSEATIKLDLKSGMPAESTQLMEMTMGGDGAPMTMSMKMTQTVKQIEAPAKAEASAKKAEEPKKEGK
jgi:hypothetical protein